MCSKQKLLAFAIFAAVFGIIFETAFGGPLDVLEGLVIALTLFLVLVLAQFGLEFFEKKLKQTIPGRYLGLVAILLLLNINTGIMISSYQDQWSRLYMNVLLGPALALGTPGLLLTPADISSAYGPQVSMWWGYLVSAIVALVVFMASDALAARLLPQTKENAQMKPKKAKKQKRK